MGVDAHGTATVTERRANQRGSALLVVFVFAAFVAIMLYREMPVAAFEAQRQREQLLVDRGMEYKRAFKLYYRKFNGTYPASFDALENTNRMRFLRHRFKDPLTGKDDWRLLHVGAGGVIVDSKVNPLKTDNNGGSFAGNSTFGGTNSSANNNSSANSNANSANAPVAPVSFGPPGQSAMSSQSSPTGQNQIPQVPQRPPAISASGAPSNGDNPDLNAQNLPPPSGQMPATDNRNGQNPGDQGQAGASGPNQPSQTLNNINQMLRNPMATQPTNSNSSSSAFGQTNLGGNLAGVASKIEGHTIKTIDDQSDYSRWEFYYDPRKDQTIALNGGPAGSNPQNGAQGTNNQGTNNQSSGSGFSSNFGSTFGSSQPANNQNSPNSSTGSQTSQTPPQQTQTPPQQ